MIFSLRKMVASFKYALKGLRYATGQQNFRIHLVAAILIVGLMIYLPLTTIERVVLIGLILTVLILEVLNTIFERLADVLRPRINPVIETVKDLMAAAVLIGAVGSVVIGILILYPYIIGK